jgi:predicted lysophospholipase L1 biosynthesis ABC-type transport system permease subunit
MPANRLRGPGSNGSGSYRWTEQRYLSPATMRRRWVQKRRRDVLFTLVAAMVASLALAFIPGFRMMFIIHVLVDIVFLTYIGLLIRLRNLAAEREMKLTFLPAALASERVRAGRRAVAGYRAASGYGAGGYPDALAGGTAN